MLSRIEYYKRKYINCIYLSGLLIASDSKNPLAIVSRRHLNADWGKEEEFKEIIKVSN